MRFSFIADCATEMLPRINTSLPDNNLNLLIASMASPAIISASFHLPQAASVIVFWFGLSYANVFIPQSRICFNEILHHFNAFIVVNDNYLNSFLNQQRFSTHVCFVFTNDDPRNSIQQYSSCAHRTRGECRVQNAVF